MIALDWPWVLLMLPLPWLIRTGLPRAEAHIGAALRLPFLDELPIASQSIRPARWQWAIAWLAWGLLVLAAARPTWMGEAIPLPLMGRELVLAVDLSGSMAAEDYQLAGRPANRLDVVKAVAGHFIERRQGDRLGLILFGSRAYIQTPLTDDRTTVRTLLNQAVIGLAGRETAIGDAIGLAVKHLGPSTANRRILVLLTDGANTAGELSPPLAAQLAAQAGLRIYTIGIGGGPVGVKTPFGTLLQAPSDLDPATLQAIAETTGGRYFQATDTAQLEKIYAELDRLEPSHGNDRWFRPTHALYVWPAGIALLLSLVLALGSTNRRFATNRESAVLSPGKSEAV
ncbi:Ca-activated chloride channel homolog [Gammaproteobacteria bacterium]